MKQILKNALAVIVLSCFCLDDMANDSETCRMKEKEQREFITNYHKRIQEECRRNAEDRQARMRSVREKLCRMAKENPGKVLPVKELFGYSLGGKVHDPNCQTGTFLNVEWNIRLSSNKDNAAFCISGTLTNGIASVRAANMLTESLKAKVEDHFGIKFKPLPSESLVYRHWYRWRGEHEELYFGTGKSQKVSEDFRTNNFYSVDIVLRDDKLNVF